MKTKEFQSFNIWSSNGQQLVNKLKLINFYGYQFDDGISYVDYQLLDINNNVMFNGTLPIPYNIIQQWNGDDNVIFNYMGTTLNIIFI